MFIPIWLMVVGIIVVLVAWLSANRSRGHSLLPLLGTSQPYTMLTVEFAPGRLLQHPGYDAIREAVTKALKSEPLVMGRLGAFWTEQLRFVFFGVPGTGDTLAWSDPGKTMSPDRCLCVRKIWSDVLTGGTEADGEPFLWITLAEDLSFYRFYLKGKGKSTVLCRFPTGLLSQQDAATVNKLLQEFGLRSIPNESVDWFQDEFEEHHLVYPEHEPCTVYENDLFKFKITHHES